MFVFNGGSTKYIVDYYTSKPYRLENKESLVLTPVILNFGLKQMTVRETDSVSLSTNMLDGELRELLKTYTSPVEDVVSIQTNMLDGELRELLKTYTSPVEDVVSIQTNMLDGELKNALIVYEIGEPIDSVSISAVMLNGELVNV